MISISENLLVYERVVFDKMLAKKRRRRRVIENFVYEVGKSSNESMLKTTDIERFESVVE